MSWNNSKERKAFETREQKLLEEYRRLGMPEEKIKELYEYDPDAPKPAKKKGK